MTKNKKSKLLLVSGVLTALYIIYIIYYFAANLGAGSSAEQAGAALASALVLPHILATGIALLFNVLAWSMGRRGFALTSGIMYGVAMLLFPFYFMFVIVQMILTFVAFAKMKKE